VIDDVPAWRREMRAQLIAARMGISAQEHRQASLAIEGFLEEALRDFPPQILSAFWPFKAEVDLRPLLQRLLAKGWTTALPKVVGRGKPLEFLRWTAEMEMDMGVHGIPVPKTRDVVQPDIMILPLVGFDAHNHRLGYGAGYFDITLASRRPRPHTIGVGFEVSRLETIYPYPTDVPLDLIVTEAGLQGKLGTGKTGGKTGDGPELKSAPWPLFRAPGKTGDGPELT
jgi:5-formyltetrahydrofolate cyclo-ligase